MSINNLKADNENLKLILDKVTQDNNIISKLKEENEELEERKIKEITQRYKYLLSNILQNLSKFKNKYLQELLKIKNEVENMNIIYESK